VIGPADNFADTLGYVVEEEYGNETRHLADWLAANAAVRNRVRNSLGSHKGEQPAARERLALLCTLAELRF
jgi:hypothetical protein